MIANSSQPVLPRAKRKPSPRNMQIYEEVRVLEQRQSDVAQRHGLSQRRVSAICYQVDLWHEWVRTAPNANEIEAQLRRKALLQARQRCEQILLIAVKHASQDSEQLVTERRTIIGDQTTVDRTVRELPIDADWLKIAARTSSDILRITERLGPDVEPSLAMQQVDALLAELLVHSDGERGPMMTELSDDFPKEGANYSSCSRDNPSISPTERNISVAGFAASRFVEMSCDNSIQQASTDNNAKNDSALAPAKVFCAGETAAQCEPFESPQNTQIAAATKLPREVRERRARFLQSCSEPGVDKMRLVNLKPW